MGRPKKKVEDTPTVDAELEAAKAEVRAAVKKPEPTEPEDDFGITAEQRAVMSAYAKEALKFANGIQIFAKQTKRYVFDMAQVENRLANMQHKIKQAEINLAKVEKEAQTRLESVEMGHRALVEKLTEEKVALQKQTAQLENERADVKRLKDELALRLSAADKTVKVLNEIG